MLPKEDLSSILQKIGFSEKEARVYLSLLELHEAFPNTIARVTGINRSTCYAILESLQKRKIIKKKRKDGHHVFYALDPQNFLEKERQKLMELRHSVEHLEESLPELQRLHEDMQPLEEDEEEQSQVNQKIQTIIREINTSPDLEEVGQVIVDIMVEYLGAVGGVLFLKNSETKTFDAFTTSATKVAKLVIPMLPKPFREYRYSYESRKKTLIGKCGVKGQIMSSKKFSDFLSPQLDEKLAKKIATLAKVKKSIAIPGKVNDSVECITFIAFKKEDIPEKQLQLLLMFSDYVAATIHNARKHEELKQKFLRLREAYTFEQSKNQAIAELLKTHTGEFKNIEKRMRKYKEEMVKKRIPFKILGDEFEECIKQLENFSNSFKKLKKLSNKTYKKKKSKGKKYLPKPKFDI